MTFQHLRVAILIRIFSLKRNCAALFHGRYVRGQRCPSPDFRLQVPSYHLFKLLVALRFSYLKMGLCVKSDRILQLSRVLRLFHVLESKKLWTRSGR